MSHTRQVRGLKAQIVRLRTEVKMYRGKLLEEYMKRCEVEDDFAALARLYNEEVVKNLRYFQCYGDIDDPSNWITPRLSAGDDNPGPEDWYNAGMDCTEDETSSTRALSGHLYGDPS